ncbi:hypothetical protein FRC10_011792 [Ceratobasidium sp. 414]|nr:hypothetical protein FRC10_011792 [Ceratobasidium sp. 414]
MSPPLKLPQEIWCLIAECLKPDKQSLSRLCQSANDMYTILLPTLYDQVHLSYPSAITEFCNTIVGKPSKLAPLVRCLQVGDHFEPCDYNQCPRFGRNDSARLHKDLAIQFRSLLELVLNLRELYLVATPRALNLCLADVKAPFKLRRLEISCVISKPFYAFLRGQSLVTRLQVFPNSRQASNTMSDLLTQNPDILPHVQIATGSIYFLNAISSSRPLSEVTITDETPSLSYRDELDRYLEYLSRLFSESNVNSVGWFRSETPEVPDLWEDIIARIKKKGPHKNIRRITVIDTPKVHLLMT